MKSRISASSRNQNNPQKQTPNRKPPVNGEHDGNGSGNGHRKAPARAKAAAAEAEHERETLTGQPDITAILKGNGGDGTVATMDSVRARNVKELDKTTLLTALLAFRKGDFSIRLPVDLDGMDGKIADAFNDVIEMNERMSEELA